MPLLRILQLLNNHIAAHKESSSIVGRVFSGIYKQHFDSQWESRPTQLRQSADDMGARHKLANFGLELGRVRAFLRNAAGGDQNHVETIIGSALDIGLGPITDCQNLSPRYRAAFAAGSRQR